jgi:hypothetical protein
MGTQPPLAVVTVKAVLGMNEVAIAQMLDLSQWDVHMRLAKGVRAVMRMVRNAPA